MQCLPVGGSCSCLAEHLVLEQHVEVGVPTLHAYAVQQVAVTLSQLLVHEALGAPRSAGKVKARQQRALKMGAV